MISVQPTLVGSLSVQVTINYKEFSAAALYNNLPYHRFIINLGITIFRRDNDIASISRSAIVIFHVIDYETVIIDLCLIIFISFVSQVYTQFTIM